MNNQVLVLCVFAMMGLFCLSSCGKLKKKPIVKVKIQHIDLTQYTPSQFFSDPKIIELCESMSKNDVRKVEALLKEGFNITAPGKDGMTPLYWAWKLNNKKMLLLLLKDGYANVRYPAYKGNSVLDEIISLNDKEYLKLVKPYWLTEEDFKNYRKTPIHNAIMQGSLERVKKLVKSGTDINQQNASGKTPIILAGQIMQFQTVYYLLKKGADPTRRDRTGTSIVFYIRMHYHNPCFKHEGMQFDYLLKCVDFLKKKGIKINLSIPFDITKRE